MPSPGEASLVAALRRGDAAAFTTAYERFGEPLHAFLRRAVGRRDEAQDLFQETWMALARRAPSLREDTDLAAWLFTVARNAFRSYLRWARLDVSRWVTLADDRYAAPMPGPDDQVENARMLSALEAALGRLPPAHREVLLLVGVQELDQDQVAHVLAISYPALRQRLARARAALAELLPDAPTRKEAHERAMG